MRLRIALAILLAALVTMAVSECVAACLGVQETTQAPPCHRHSSQPGNGALPCVHAKVVGLAPDLSWFAASPPAPAWSAPLRLAGAEFAIIRPDRAPPAAARPPAPALRI